MEENEAQEPTLEESISRLEQIVAELEKGEQELESALKAYEEGLGVARRCMERLKAAELRIEELSSDPVD